MADIIDLTGYRYARQAKKQSSHTYDAFMYQLGKEAQGRLAKEATKTTTLEWVSVSERLPVGESRMFVVLVRCVGNFKPYIMGSTWLEGRWLHCNSAETVTHWAELPEELP